MRKAYLCGLCQFSSDSIPIIKGIGVFQNPARLNKPTSPDKEFYVDIIQADGENFHCAVKSIAAQLLGEKFRPMLNALLCKPADSDVSEFRLANLLIENGIVKSATRLIEMEDTEEAFRFR